MDMCVLHLTSDAAMCVNKRWLLGSLGERLSGLILLLLVWAVLSGLNPQELHGQRARFGEGLQILPGTQGGPVISNPFAGQPAPAAGIAPNLLPRPAAAPAFDPFRTQNNPFPVFQGNQPIVGFQQPAQGIQRPFFGPVQNQPAQNFGQIFTPPQNQQPFFNNPWPQTGGPNTNTAWPNQVWARLRTEVLPRLLERPRFRHTWLIGEDPEDLDINDTEIATTMTFANWLGTSQPIRVSPGFVFHFWDGPDTAATGFDLPSRAFSVYLASDYSTDPQRPSGFETNLTVGFYSDFHNTSSDAIRVSGVGLGWMRLNSYTTFKFGVEYLDRIDIKLLPAVGVFLTPNPDLMINLYFPRPKFAQRLPRIGPYEVWSYVGAEYGGGSWAIERDPLLGPNFEDQVDINDVRAFIGVEWMGPRRVTGFFEFGYVFERELLYQSDPTNPLEIKDTFMLRTGLSF